MKQGILTIPAASFMVWLRLMMILTDEIRPVSSRGAATSLNSLETTSDSGY